MITRAAGGCLGEGRDGAVRPIGRAAMSDINDWLAYQNAAIQAFGRHAENHGGELQVLTLMFCRPPGTPLTTAVHMQRIAAVAPEPPTTETVDALVESAWSDVMARTLGATYHHSILHAGDIPAFEEAPDAS